MMPVIGDLVCDWLLCLLCFKLANDAYSWFFSLWVIIMPLSV